MAKIVLVGLEQAIGAQIRHALAADSYRIEHQPQNVLIRNLPDADIIFAGGERHLLWLMESALLQHGFAAA